MYYQVDKTYYLDYLIIIAFHAVYFSLCRISESDAISTAAKKLSQLNAIYTGTLSHAEQIKSKMSDNTELQIHTVQELKELLGVADEPLSPDYIDSPTEKTTLENGKCGKLLMSYFSNLVHCPRS